MAQVGLIDTVHFSDLDVLFFEGSGRFFVVRSKRLAVPAPSTEDEMLAWLCYNEKHGKKKREHYHGAKNSTRIIFSGSTTDLKLAGVKSMTSEAASAMARVAKVRGTRGARSEEMRILWWQDKLKKG